MPIRRCMKLNVQAALDTLSSLSRSYQTRLKIAVYRKRARRPRSESSDKSQFHKPLAEDFSLAINVVPNHAAV